MIKSGTSDSTNHKILSAVIGPSLLFAVVFILIEKYEHIPTVVFGAVTVYFSFWAYRFSHDKFRLDLFEKRWAIYEQTLKFCSIVTRHGGLESLADKQDEFESAVTAAQNSFQGIGFQKAQVLFGDDIKEVLIKLIDHFLWFLSNPRPDFDNDQNSTHEKWTKVQFIEQTAYELPKLFRKYIYFGDYKSLD